MRHLWDNVALRKGAGILKKQHLVVLSGLLILSLGLGCSGLLNAYKNAQAERSAAAQVTPTSTGSRNWADENFTYFDDEFAYLPLGRQDDSCAGCTIYAFNVASQGQDCKSVSLYGNFLDAKGNVVAQGSDGQSRFFGDGHWAQMKVTYYPIDAQKVESFEITSISCY